ncbi:unnamed protein product [Euphydryas editha]|nr:unnamed protein product [Euphydryas editha]
MRLIGVGLSGINKFCGLMELGTGISSSIYYKIIDSISIAVKSVFDVVMLKAVREEKLLNAQHGEPEDILTVSGDDQVTAKHARKRKELRKRLNMQRGTKHTKETVVLITLVVLEKWKLTVYAKCFSSSLEKFSVRYGFYIGDGDTKTFKMLLNTQPYGEDFIIKKLECVLHVAKRVFKRASEAKKILTQARKAAKKDEKKNPEKKSAAKTVVAKKRKTVVKKNPTVKTQDLTIKLMKELSRNYGLAIQRHPDSVEEMRKEIWAGFFHKISTDSNPQHSYCSESWCKYKIAVKNNSVHKFKHPPALAKDVQEVLKPIYDDLTKQELLERCLGGNTQNNNESFNNCVWSMAPKHIFCGKKIVEIACQTAACIFNEGFHPVLKIMEVMGVKIGPIAAQFAADCDRTRIRVANRRSTDASKEARTKRRQAILDENEHYEEDEGIMYGAGIAD